MQEAESRTPSIAHALDYLAGTMVPEGSMALNATSIEMPQAALIRAMAMIEQARQEERAGNRDGAWFLFSEAKALAHYHYGIAAGRFASPAAKDLRRHLEEIGGMGGTQKGLNARARHDHILEQVLQLAAGNPWCTLVDLQEAIRRVARQLEGDGAPSLSDRRLNALLKEPAVAEIARSLKEANRRRRPGN